MDWTQPIDAYCERAGAGFWAEPVNALTNAAFLIAAVALLASWRQAGRTDWPALALITTIAVIGAGSFLFHTFAERWAALADVLPITVFIYGYFYLAMRRFFALSAAGAVGGTLVFLAASWSIGAALPAGFLNGSGAYLPALFAIIVVALLLRSGGSRAASGIMVAGAVFAVSLTARSVDEAVCAGLPLGTHFLWHCLNALVLYLLVRTYMAAGPER